MSRVVARRRVAVVVAIANANSSEDGGGHGDDNLHDYLPHIDVNFAHDIYFLRLMFFLIGGGLIGLMGLIGLGLIGLIGPIDFSLFTFPFSLPSSPAAALALSADTACSGDTVASSSARAWWA